MTLPNVTLHIQQQGEGPPLIILPGWGMHTELMQPLLLLLAKQFTLHEIDLPGCGHNATFNSDLALNHLTSTLADHLPSSAPILGWSMGGLIATQLAHVYPDKISRLICIASSPHFIESDNWPGMTIDNLQFFKQQLVDDPAQTLQYFLQLQCLGSEQPQATLKHLKRLWEKRAAPTTNALLGGLALLIQSDLRPILPQLRQQVLMIFGEQDHIVPLATRDAVSQLADNIEHATLANASHMPFLTHPDECNQIIQAFLP